MLLKHLMERNSIDDNNAEAILTDFKFALSHIKKKIKTNPDEDIFDQVKTLLQSELNLSNSEAGAVARLLNK